MSSSLNRPPALRWLALVTALAVGGLAAACSSSGSSSAMSAGMAVTPQYSAASMMAPSPDPRVGLKGGWMDAEEATWNLNLISNTPPPDDYVGVTNSDLAFTGNYVIQGNYDGYHVWDVSDSNKPSLVTSYRCPASQSDVSVYKNLLFVSGEGLGGRLDCGIEGVPEAVSMDRLRGLRIFDITDITRPRYIANVQTCRGSHTHTVVSDPNDSENVYVYISGSSRIRSDQELAGCSDGTQEENAGTALFRIEVIKVPLANPEEARIVSSPRIFDDLEAPVVHAPPVADTIGRGARMAGRPPRIRRGPTQCHDITVYPAMGLAGGACGGYGLLLDISDVVNPKRLYAAADSNFSFWHSATFSNDGSAMLFGDEWGGGGQPRCRVTDKMEWGANALFSINNKRLKHESYFKMPAPQTSLENCVAHNGNQIPVPGREIMVQAWYQGGIDIFDWTDPANPYEIAFHDRGPMNDTTFVSGGSWSVYYYNGLIYSSAIARGLDVFELVPNGHLTQNEIDAAKTVEFEFFNAQEQQQFVWPATFVLAGAYLDQLARDDGLAAGKIAAARTELAAAEAMSGSQRRSALNAVASSLESSARSAGDRAKVNMLVDAVKALAAL